MVKKTIAMLLMFCIVLSASAFANGEFDTVLAEETANTVQNALDESILQEEIPAGESSEDVSEGETTSDEDAVIQEVEYLPAVSFSSVSPFYEGDIPVTDGISVDAEAPVLMSDAETDTTYVRSLEDAADIVREAMRNRETEFPLYICLDRAIQYNDLKSIFEMVLEHTGAPCEGDYIRWHYIAYDCTANGFVEGGEYFYTVTFTVSYYTTYEQEVAVSEKAAEILNGLHLDGKTSYGKVLAIYEYLCENVTYDYVHLEDNAYTLKYSSYAALCEGTSVCQGYASSFYRLCLEAGLDCRLIAGTAGNVKHGWNIVKLGDYYYNMDATYDAGESEYTYFLCGSSNFPDHEAMSEYYEESFTSSYPLDDDDYVWTLIGDVNGSGDVSNTDAVILVRHLSDWDVHWDAKASDINQDSSITIVDYTMLCRFMAGWEVLCPIGHRA